MLEFSRIAMKRIFAIAALVWTLACFPGTASAGWEQVADILGRVVEPTFPTQDFVITNYGAVGDGRTDDSMAIRRTIAVCAQRGGGRVIVPLGDFLTGPIHLCSNVELHLAKGATLKFCPDPKLYLPAVQTRFEGTECYNYSPLIYALGQTNIAVTGEGTLDGQADDTTWLAWRGRKGAPAGTQNEARERLEKMNNDGVPVSQRVFGKGDFLRPDFIEFNECRQVLIQGVKIRRSPMWELHPLLCTNVTVRGINIASHGANNDGCDPESCCDVLIEKCWFDTGDDCVAIKSGRNADGRRVGIASQNIVIRDCTMRAGHGGTTIGSEISGGCRNVFVENCEMDSPELTCVLRVKSNAMRGGRVENIFMRNIRVGQVKHAVLQIDFLYEEGAKGSFNPVAKNIVLENLTVARTPQVLDVRGFPAATISGVRIIHSDFKQVQKPDVVEYAEVILEDCTRESGK
jgi:polygalacturonase